MPTVSDVNLSLTTVGNSVTIEVDYDVSFTQFDRNLADLGLTYDSHIIIRDFDGGDSPGSVILEFPRDALPVTNTTQQLPNRRQALTVARSVLQGDGGGDPDEIKATVLIHANQWLDEYTEEVASEQQILLG
ncbi:MAG: hypothetical protein ABWX96_01325 [Propionibacteriaceae bacterium]